MWDSLTSVPESGEVLDAFTIISLFVFGVSFLAAAVFSARPGTSPIGVHYSRRFIILATTLIGWASGIGLFFLLIRLLQINPLSLGTPIWIVFAWLLLIAAWVYVGITSIPDKESRRRNREAGAPTTPKRPSRRNQ